MRSGPGRADSGSESFTSSWSGIHIKFRLPFLFALVSSAIYLACTPTSDNDHPQGGAGSSSGGGSPSGAGAPTGGSGASAGNGASGQAGAGTSEGGEGPGSSGDAGSAGSADIGGDAGSIGVGGDGQGSTEQAGAVTFETYAFYQPALLFDADGALHMAFNLNTSPSSVYYARCAADCGVGSNWETTIIDTHNTTGRVRMVSGSDKRLHLIYEADDPGSDGLIYATCASDCTDARNWTKTNIASLFAFSWSSPSNGVPLVIDAKNRLTFTVDRKIYLNGGLTLATCAESCSTLSNWSAGTIRPNGTRTSLAARGTTLHQLVDNTTTNSNATALSYRTCSSNCTDPASWQELTDLFVYDGAQPTAIAVTAKDEVRVVYNQGPSAANQSAAIKAQDNKMLIWGCDANCLDKKSWSGFTIGAAGDGAEGIAMAELGGALVLSVTNTSRVLTRYCTENCLVDSNWGEAVVDTTDALTDAYDPYTLTGTTCVDRAPQTATWHLQHGVVAIRPDGALAFAHAGYLLRQCPLSSVVDYRPGYGRVVFFAP